MEDAEATEAHGSMATERSASCSFVAALAAPLISSVESHRRNAQGVRNDSSHTVSGERCPRLRGLEHEPVEHHRHAAEHQSRTDRANQD